MRMNRPADYNPWSRYMNSEMLHILDTTKVDDETKVLVITGTGRAFSAGGDADTILPTYIDSGDALKWARDAALLTLRNFLQVFKEYDKPVIAAVNGVVAGAAFGLQAMCDIRIGSENARFGNIYMRRGTVASMAPYYLTQAIGVGHSTKLIFGDQVIDAAEALRIGLVSQVVQHEEFPKVVLDMAEEIAAQPVDSLRLVKNLMRTGQYSDIETIKRMAALSAVVAQQGSKSATRNGAVAAAASH
jgi:2-(1,2-epoxy-1,2-dihydrophenyl)acetyl-CoA isomerase